MSVCCFTGHRELPQEAADGLRDRLEQTITHLISQGVTEFRAGGALGFDTVAALAVLEQREKYPHIRLVLMLPCADQDKSWGAADRRRYQSIKQAADEVNVLAEHYYRGCMFVRNRALVDGSEYCVCFQCHPGGGTQMTVDYAGKKGLKIINVGGKTV